MKQILIGLVKKVDMSNAFKQIIIYKHFVLKM